MRVRDESGTGDDAVHVGTLVPVRGDPDPDESGPVYAHLGAGAASER